MLTLLIALAATAAASAQAPDTVRLVVAATTDVHGRATAWDYVRDTTAPYGLTRAATMVESLRARYGDRLILVDAGDLLQGNAFAAFFAGPGSRPSHPIIDAMNAMGYDAATPGNHEFNFGLDALDAALRGASFAYVSANIEAVPANTLVYPATVVLPRAGVRVGVTGVTTPGVMVWDRALVAGRRRVVPAEVGAARGLQLLDRAGVDFKIVLIHSGMDGESTYDTTGVGAENVAAQLAMLTPKPDLVVVGHSHRRMVDSVINGVHFIQPQLWARSLVVAHVMLVREQGAGGGAGAGGAGSPWRVVEIRGQEFPLADVPGSPRLARRLAAAHEEVRLWANEALGEALDGFDARAGRAEDAPIADFINEVMRRKTGAQLAATAVFDVAVGLGPGEIRRRELYGVYPYENTLRAVRVSGAQLRAFLEHSARYYRTYEPSRRIVNDSIPGYNFDVVSGAVYNIDLAQPPGRRIRGLRVGGQPVADTASFTLALSSYRQEGGGGYAMLKGAPVVYDRAESVRDLLAAEIQRVRTLRPQDYFVRSWAIIPPEAAQAARAAFGPAPRAAAAAPAAPLRLRPIRDTVLFRLFATTDLHGTLQPQTYPWSRGRPVGGLAALKGWIDSLTRECRCATLRLDGGDEMQGTPISNWSSGRATVAGLNALGLDAAAIGNHEFDWTVDTLVARQGEARYRWLAANITEAATGARPAWAEPWATLPVGGAKVAVIGLITRETPTVTRPTNVAHLRFEDGASAVKRLLPAVRATRPDAVIVVAHAGAECDSAGACSGEIIDLARGLDSAAVDLIVAGHTHRPVNTVVNGIPIVEARSNGTALAVVDFVHRISGRLDVRPRLETPFADVVRPDSTVRAVLEPFQRLADSVGNRPVVTFKTALRRSGPEHPLGRLIADAERAAARADVAIINNGGIRADVEAGLARYGDLFRVQPFENMVLRLTLRGDVLLAALEHALASGQPDAHVSGVEVWYDARRARGGRITRTRLASGGPIERDRTYTLAALDFLAVGGSGFSMLVGQPAEPVGVADLDAFVRYLRQQRQPVEAPASPRFHGVER